MDQILERTIVGMAHALFMNRLHLLRLTEVVRLGISPNSEDDNSMELPEELDSDLREQAINFVLTYIPSDFHVAIHAAKVDWLRPA